jgi:hypothetical protein
MGLGRVKRKRPPSSRGGTARVTSFVIASQRDVGVSGQPFIEYTVAITVVRVQFTRAPPGFKVRTGGGQWLTPSQDTPVAVHIPPPAERSR